MAKQAGDHHNQKGNCFRQAKHIPPLCNAHEIKIFHDSSIDSGYYDLTSAYLLTEYPSDHMSICIPRKHRHCCFPCASTRLSVLRTCAQSNHRSEMPLSTLTSLISGAPHGAQCVSCFHAAPPFRSVLRQAVPQFRAHHARLPRGYPVRLPVRRIAVRHPSA